MQWENDDFFLSRLYGFIQLFHAEISWVLPLRGTEEIPRSNAILVALMLSELLTNRAFRQETSLGWGPNPLGHLQRKADTLNVSEEKPNVGPKLSAVGRREHF